MEFTSLEGDPLPALGAGPHKRFSDGPGGLLRGRAHSKIVKEFREQDGGFAAVCSAG
jgi:hypothetical protein